MKRIFCLFFAAIISLALFVTTAHAFISPPPVDRPVQIKSGLYLNELVSVNESTETMHFNAMLTLQWKDPRLAFHSLVAGVKVKEYETEAATQLLSKIWHPQIDLIGGTGPRVVKMINLMIRDDGVVTWREAFEADSSIIMNLRRFPFDGQTFQISLQPFIKDASQAKLQVFEPYSGVSKTVRMQGWDMQSVVALTHDVLNPLYKKTFSRYTLFLHYKRLTQYYIYELVLPISLIVLLSFSVFWMLGNPLVNRVAISLTAILTIVVFQWRLLTKLPQINYHTFADVFMLTSFVVAVSTVLASLMLDHVKKDKLKQRYARICRIGYPILYLLAILVVALFFY